MKKTEEQQLARDLYFQTELPQAEIARRTGVSEKTVYLWIREGKWQQLRAAARRMPSMLVEQYFDQLSEMNDAIAQRQQGERYASPKEAETMRKLLACVTTVQKQMSCAAQTEVLMGYIGHVMKKDLELAQQMVAHGDDYLKGKAVNGYEPYEMGYTSTPDQDTLADEIVNAYTQPIPNPEIETPNCHPERSEGTAGQEADADGAQLNPSPEEQATPSAVPQPQAGGNTPEIETQNCHPERSEGTADAATDAEENEQQLDGNNPETEPTSLSPGEGRGEVSPRCWKDPDDPYTTYYACGITKREYWSPKYGLPPEGFRECPPTVWPKRKDPLWYKCI